MNGDGLADVVVGALGGDPGGDSNAGESYVIFGRVHGAAVDSADIAAGIGGFVINGIDVNDTSGFSVSGPADQARYDDVTKGCRRRHGDKQPGWSRDH